MLAFGGLKFQVHSAAREGQGGAQMEGIRLPPQGLRRREVVQVHGGEGTVSCLFCKRRPSLPLPC